MPVKRSRSLVQRRLSRPLGGHRGIQTRIQQAPSRLGVTRFFARGRVPTRPDRVTFNRATLLERVGKALFPWDADRYPGLHASLVALFGNRVAYGSIKHWRVGRRAMPPWAAAVLELELRRRISELESLHAECKREIERLQQHKDPPGMLRIDPITGTKTMNNPKRKGPD